MTHRSNALTKGGRESVEDIHSWREPLGESLIAASSLIEVVGLPFKYGEDSTRRNTAFNLLCEWVGRNILPGLPLVLSDGFIED